MKVYQELFISEFLQKTIVLIRECDRLSLYMNEYIMTSPFSYKRKKELKEKTILKFSSQY